MINQFGDEFSILNSINSTNSNINVTNSNNYLNSYIVNDVNSQQYSPIAMKHQNQNYVQPIKIFQQQPVPQPQQQQIQYQIHQFKTININDEIISPLSNSSSTSSSSSMSSSSSTSSTSSLSSSSNNLNTSNNCISTETNNKNQCINHNSNTKDKTKLKIKSLNENYVSSSKSNQKKMNSKKKASQVANDLDEERTSQLVSELLRNIKEKTKQLESLNQHIKSSHGSCSSEYKTKHQPISDSINQINSPASSPSINTSINETNNKIINLSTPSKRPRNKVKHLKPISNINKEDFNNSSQEKNIKFSSEKFINVPNGWQRLLENTGSYSVIIYKSPSGIKFECTQDIRKYLLEADTCKCGLECPLNIYETFNFDTSIKNAPSTNTSSSTSLSDLSNKLNSCCLHRLNESIQFMDENNNKRFINEETTTFKKKRITNENDDGLEKKIKHYLIDEQLQSVQQTNVIYQFPDEDVETTKLALDGNEFNLIQLNNDKDINSHANLILDSAYLNSLNINDELELIQMKSNSTNQLTVSSDNNENRNNLTMTQINISRLNNNHNLIINNDLLISSSLNSLANAPVILTPHSAASNSIMDFSATSINNKNIFNFYTSPEEKNFDKAILRMISNDCNEIINDDSLELNVSSHHFSSNANSNQNLLSSNFIPQDLSDLCRLVND